MRAISLGAGVQSSTVLLMVKEGELKADCAIFADTGWEPKAVYRHLDWLDSVSTIPIYRVSAGNLRDDALSDGHRFASMPLHLLNPDGSRGFARRQCTREYKVDVITRKLRELIGAAPRTRIPSGAAESLMGISLDEVQRMKQSRERWITNVYPLVDRRMSRHDCTLWLERHEYPTPPKSACIGCPFHDNAYWRAMRDARPDEWADAVSFDDQLRAPDRGRMAATLRGTGYLHADRVPLRNVDLSTSEDAGQTDLFGAECEGMCGV